MDSISLGSSFVTPSNPATIPDQLKHLPQWVCWRYEERNGKQTKAPIDAKSNGQLHYAKTNDSATWASLNTALNACGIHPELAGVGFCFSPSDGLTGIDLDHVLDPDTKVLTPEAAEIVARFAETYIEVSPSGTGLRLFCKGKPARSGKNVGKGKWLEVYAHPSSRYLTVTGQHWPSSAREATDQQDALDWLHERFMASTEFPPVDSKPAPASALNLDDSALLAKATQAKNGAAFAALWRGDLSAHGNDHSAADLALCNLLAFWTDGDAARMDRLFRQSGLMRDKWDESHYSDGRTYGQATVAKAISSQRDGYKSPEENQRAEQDRWLKHHVFITSEGLYVDTRNGNTYTPSVFRQVGESAFPKGWGKIGAPPLAFSRCGGTFVSQDCYLPGKPKIIENREYEGISTLRYNTYRKPVLPDPVYDADKEALFVEHLRYLCGNDEACVQRLLDWMATLIQKPGQRVHWAPVLISPAKGCGKSLVGKILTLLLGSANVSKPGNKGIGGQFDDALAFKQLIIIEEIRQFEDENIKLNEFKTWITEDYVPCNRKGRPQITIENVANTLALSNFEIALNLDPDERRYMAAVCPFQPKSPEYYQQFARAFLPESGGDVGAILHLLMNRDLSQFNPYAPAIQTEARERMSELTRTPVQQEVAKMLKNGTNGLDNDLITNDELLTIVKSADFLAHGGRAKGVSNAVAARVARIVGIEPLGQKRITTDGQKTSVYAVRDHKYWRTASEGAIRDWFQSHTLNKNPDPSNSTTSSLMPHTGVH